MTSFWGAVRLQNLLSICILFIVICLGFRISCFEFYLRSTLYNGPTIWILAGARRLKYVLKSVPEKEAVPASPDTFTPVVRPPPKSAATAMLETLLNGLPPRFFSSSFTLFASHVSVPAGFGWSGWYTCSFTPPSFCTKSNTLTISATSSGFNQAVPP